MLRKLVKQAAARLPAVFELAKGGEILGQFLSRQPHESDYLFYARHAPPQGVFLDVGANTGQSALSFASVRPGWSIVSVEANPACRPWLEMTRRLLGRRHRYILAAASDADGRLSLFVPRNGRFFHTQETTTDAASLNEGIARARIGTSFIVEQFEVSCIVLDNLDLKPDVIKLDVQGAELKVLQGLVRTIERVHPLLMIENGPIIPSVAEFLGRYGYQKRSFDGVSLSSFNPDALNVFFTTPAHWAALSN
jgi:FkbM family methyltransferase